MNVTKEAKTLAVQQKNLNEEKKWSIRIKKGTKYHVFKYVTLYKFGFGER